MRLCIATSSYPSQIENSFSGFLPEILQRNWCEGETRSPFSHKILEIRLFKTGGLMSSLPLGRQGDPCFILRPYHPHDVFNILMLLQKGRRSLFGIVFRRKWILCGPVALPLGTGNGGQKASGIPLAIWSLGSISGSTGGFQSSNAGSEGFLANALIALPMGSLLQKRSVH